MLASNPSAAQPCVLEIARGLCHADTAGLSMLSADRAGGMTVRWELVRGALAPYEGIDATRTNSPCGLCLDAGATIRVSHPARAFAWLEGTHPPITETLIVPLRDDTGSAYGTLWIAHHEPDARSTCDDARILEQLAQQLMLALLLQEHAKDRDRAFTLLQSLQMSQQALLTGKVDNERIRRMQAEATARKTARDLLFKEAMIDEVNHRTKNTLHAASAVLAMQANATSSVDVRRALLDSHARLQLLAQAHALLCIEQNDTQSVFMPRLLQTVCDALATSFGETCPGVRLQVSCDPLSLPADQAITIALLANEVVTNSYKHAFANQSSGEISVQLHCSSEHAMVLQISDTGTGANLPQGERGMGFKLMRLLSEQMQGALDVASPAAQGGTQVTLTLGHATACKRAPDAIVPPPPAMGTAA